MLQIPWGFSLSWGRPPRVERVDPGSPAECSGLRPGDYIVFVETQNVVILPRDEILSLIQSATGELTFEVYRKGGVYQRKPSAVPAALPAHGGGQHAITFTSEVGSGVLV